MRLFKYKILVAFWKKHPEAKEALTRWAELVETSNWTSHADLKDIKSI